MNKTQLAIYLSQLKVFNNPKIKWEQYSTPPDVASELVWQAYIDGNIENKTVFDLGCGTGILAIGAKLLGAKKVIGFDIDENALKIARENAKNLEIEFRKENVLFLEEKCDTVLTNPPFGLKGKIRDIYFLKKAFEISENVYSIHKAETLNFLKRFGEENLRKPFVFKKMSFLIKNQFWWHDKQKHRFNVVLIRWDKINL